MNAREFWKLFCATGAPEFYLFYKEEAGGAEETSRPA